MKPLTEEYPELDKAARVIEQTTILTINQVASHTKSDCPYKAQALLEMLITRLEKDV